MAMLKAVCMASLLCCVSSGDCAVEVSKCVKIPNARLLGRGHDHWHSYETVEDCMKLCTQHGCSSFDWHKDAKMCSNVNGTENTDDDDESTHAQITHYLGFNPSDVGAPQRSGLKYGNHGYDHYACESIAKDLLCHGLTPEKRMDGIYQWVCGHSPKVKIMVIPNAAIAGHNTKRLTKQTFPSCAQACFKQSWCKSFDWHKHANACDLSDKSAADVGGLKHDYSGNPYDHFALVCNNCAQRYRRLNYGTKYQDQQIMERIMESAPMMNTSLFRACIGSISLGGIAMGFLVLRRARKQTGHGEEAIMAQMSGTTSGEE